MKTFIKLILLIFIISFTSCYNKVEFRNGNRYPVYKDDELKPVAVVINAYFDDIKSTNSLINDDSIKAIKDKVKSDLESKIKRPAVYFSYKDHNQISEIKKMYDKTLLIEIKISRDFNYTVILDSMSIIYPIVAPEWGKYIFDIKVEVDNKENKTSQKYNYLIESDFSYMIYPIYRNEPEVQALKRGLAKFLLEMINDKDFINLVDNTGELSFEYFFNHVVEEEGNRLIQRDNNYSSFPIAIDFRKSWGLSTIDGYYKDSEGKDALGATGQGDLIEYHLQASTFKPKTKFILSPTFGYYYQDIKIADFGRDVRDENSGIGGYIPGKVEERDPEGNLINSENVYSMKYESQFSSTYLGGEIGINLVYGDDVHFIFSPMFYFSLVEARHTTIIAGDNEFSDWTFPFLGMLGGKLETGLFFSKAHFGIKFGYDFAYFRKFDFEHDIKFNSIVRTEEGLLKSKKIEINRFETSSHKLFIDIFVLF